MKNYFDVDVDGFAEIQRGRQKWEFPRELISNSLDEKITVCKVSVEKDGRNPAIITVEDDGSGFNDLKDAYTLFAPTKKRVDPSVRGRFNLGEKEFASIAKTMVIESTKGGVRFENGERSRINKKRAVGTKVTVEVNWSQADVAEIIGMLNLFIPPKDKRLEVNGREIQSPVLIGSVEERLKTTILNDGSMSNTVRKTNVDVYGLKPDQEKGYLYELGIPIQPIECPYNVDVQQKVPMSPNRESVNDSYLMAIYGIVLNIVRDEIDVTNASEAWVHTGMEDDSVNQETVKKIMVERHGNKAVLWSSDTLANERAKEAGYEIVHPRTMSQEEREKFRDAGMEASSAKFGLEGKVPEIIDESKWTPGMKSLAEYTDYVSKLVYEEPIEVEYYKDAKIIFVASYSIGKISYNLAHISKDKLEPPFNEYMTGLILHELAHREGDGHYDKAYIHELQRIAGKLVIKVAEDPLMFEKMRNGG